jgi:hypothetical protein
MNGSASKNQLKHMNRLMSWSFLCVSLLLSLVRPVPAADAVYQNDAIINYPVTVDFPPVIDATNFVNNNSFTINFPNLFIGNPIFYETSDTINYTNNGSMFANTGFIFDTQSAATGAHTMAGNFINPGMVGCGSVNNLTDPFGGQLGLFDLVQCVITATNIVNPGTVDIGVNGMLQLTGQNLDLSYGTMLNEGSGANTAGTGVFGLNTNGWNPGQLLRANFAASGPIPIPPFTLILPNSTAYIDITSPDPSNNIIRAVFIEDFSGSNVTYNVYFPPLTFRPLNPFSSTNAVVEWVGSYLDPASGNNFKSYLYLNDDYLYGAATNLLFTVGGYPANFTFQESSTPLPIGVPPTAAGFQNIFPDGSITNRYAFADVQLISTTVSTNSLPSHSITNLPGRIQISAAKDLNLAFAQITGPNYLSVVSTNQFDGSAGASIKSPYSDFNLGVTNGFLTLSNLSAPQVPNWSGEVQAYSTRWQNTDTNSGFTVTNTFCVLIVGSQLTPTTRAQVQEMFLHSTNSLVISDSFNIIRTLSVDAQNLTLTTNGPAVGATSLSGELNFVSGSTILWQTALPNLRNLTNNGAIRTFNLAAFGNPLVINSTPTTPAVAATGVLSQLGAANVARNETVTIGSAQYTFVTALQNGAINQVKLGTTFDISMGDLIAAINHASGSGSKYSTGTTANIKVTAGALANHVFPVTAITAGTAGNSIVTTTTSTHLTWNGHGTLAGGVDYIAGSTNDVTFPYDNFINNGLVSDQGSVIYAKNFVSSGVVSNGIGSFTLQSKTTVLTNGSILAGGDISITAASLVASNVMLTAGRSLTLQVTNFLTDSDVTNENFWISGGATGVGLKLPIKPATGDLRRTTITNTASAVKNVVNTWAGQDWGISTAGYTNNVAVGRLILDSLSIPPLGLLTFTGTGTSNALYVDYLGFMDQATNRDVNGNVTVLSFNTNLVIYYAQAVINGVSVAEKLNHKNNDHLRWVPAYAGYYSSTNLIYGGMTNIVNAALAQSVTLDSDGDGIPNAFDATPFFTAADVNLTMVVTNIPPMKVLLTWQTIPSATNIVFYKTNLVSSWMVLTNFTTPPSPPYAPITEMLYDLVNPVQPRYYQVRVDPNSVYYYGP